MSLSHEKIRILAIRQVKQDFACSFLVAKFRYNWMHEDQARHYRRIALAAHNPEVNGDE